MPFLQRLANLGGCTRRSTRLFPATPQPQARRQHLASDSFRLPAAVHYQMLMYAYASTSSGGGVEVEVDAPDLPAVIATTASYGHGAHPDGPSSTSRGCTWAYILDEVR